MKNFYKDSEKFKQFSDNLPYEQKQEFLEIVGEAIQYGITVLFEKLTNETSKKKVG